MKYRITALAGSLLAACAAMSCGSIGADGGQSGTGISAIRGNVVAAPGTHLDVAGIHVILTEPGLETNTDTTGHFELRGQASGPSQLRFERSRDGLSASTEVVIPAGGVLELEDIELDPESDEAHPTTSRVEFDGVIDMLDCAGGKILVAAKEDEGGTVFTVETASATIRQDTTPLQCSDLLVGDHVEVHGETPDGLTLVNAEVILEDRVGEPGDDTQNPGDNGDSSSENDGMDESNGDNGDESGTEGMDDPNGDNGNTPENQGVDEPGGQNGGTSENEGVDDPDGGNGDAPEHQGGVGEPTGNNGNESQD